MANKILWKLPLVAVVVGLALSSVGCASLGLGNLFYQGAETEQSKNFLDGANDILTQNQDGYPALQFKRKHKLLLLGSSYKMQRYDTARELSK